jgi:hypothetical protein
MWLYSQSTFAVFFFLGCVTLEDEISYKNVKQNLLIADELFENIGGAINHLRDGLL